MYEIVQFQPSFAEDFGAFDADFIDDSPSPSPAAPVGEHRAWLLSHVVRRDDLGMLKSADGWFDFRSRLEELAEANDDEREIADLRNACRNADSWRSGDFDWPQLTD